MNWLPYLSFIHFSAFLLYSFLGIILLYYNYKSKVNRIASYLIFCFAIWSLVKIFSHNTSTPENIVLYLENIFSISWILAPGFAFFFFAALTKRDSLLKNKTFHILFILIVLIIYFQILTGNVFYDFELKDYGWFRKWKNNIWVYFYYIYFISFVASGLFFLYKEYIKTRNKIKKRILETFVIASIGTFILSVAIEFLEIIFNYYNIKKSCLEDLTNLYAVIFVLSFFYLISKYKFLKISPVYAAETIISSMNESVIIADDEINISFMNENAKNTFAQNSDYYIGKSFAILFKNKNEINILLKQLIKNNFIKNFETELLTSGNKIIPVLISAATINELGETIGFVFVVSDITEFKKAQNILKESYNKLIEVDILKTNFLSMVSHELRTPLTTIMGFLSLILGGAAGKVPEQLKEYLEIMQKNSQRLLSLINDLLDLSKLEAGTFTISKVKTDIIHLIKETINNLKPVYSKKNINVYFDTTINSIKINIDPMRITQVLSNLMNNAVKFSKNNSKITILTFLKDKNDLLFFDKNSLQYDNYIIIKIIDEGKGMTPEVLKKIFEKFYQAEDINTRKAQGAGLGLYITKEIINKHNGLIWAESDGINKGTTFTIALPIE